jgi:hypothetical protein
MNPLMHFEEFGWQEGRNPGGSFNTDAYVAAHPGLPAGEDPLVAYINSLAVSSALIMRSVATTALATTSTVMPTITLTTGQDSVAGLGNDNFVTASNTLSSGDKIDAGSGTNTLSFSGGGNFNLALPTKLNDIQSLSAQEGQGATAQVVTSRAGLNLTVDVAPDESGDPLGVKLDAATKLMLSPIQFIHASGGNGNDTITAEAADQT